MASSVKPSLLIVPSETLELFANGLVADPRITAPNARFDSRRDAGLPGVPRASANVGFSWRRPLGERFQLLANGGLSYVGASRLTFDGRQQYRMGDYGTGTATVFVENLFDTEVNPFPYSDPFRLPDGQAIAPLRPRTIGLTLK